MIIQANSLNVPLKDESVHCVVTSPPYWGLRDYSVNGQLGLEKTPEEFIENCVKWAREVWRVLRKDGTFWLNLGSSYASSDMNPSQSPLLSRVPACGNYGKEFLYSLMRDRACYDSCDEPQDGKQNHHVDNSHNDQHSKPVDAQPLQKDHDNERLDSVQASLDVSPRVARKSTTRASFRRDRAACVPLAKASASPSKSVSSSGDVHSSVDRSACISDTYRKVPPLAVHTQGKESFFSACNYPGCKGIGRCGLCWCNLAIPSLNIKRKDLIDIPHLVADALEADGWYKRSALPWLKRSAMPESCTDRPASALEYMFLLTKSSKYYFDMTAIRKESSLNTHNRMTKTEIERIKTARNLGENTSTGKGGTPKSVTPDGMIKQNDSFENAVCLPTNGRNFRNTDLFYQSLEEPHGAIFAGEEMVGLDVNPQAYKEAHFATFPEKLVEPLIKVGTSERGACPECGAPWERVVEKKVAVSRETNRINLDRNDGGKTQFIGNESKTIGWQPTCSHREEPVPCIVLDPFGGACTTEWVSKRLGRKSISLELKMDYCLMGKKRCVSNQEELNF